MATVRLVLTIEVPEGVSVSVEPEAAGAGTARRKIRRRETWAGVNALAEELGVNPGTVSRVLTGQKRSLRIEAAALARGWRPGRQAAKARVVEATR